MVDDSDTSLSDANNNRTGLVMEVESGAELAGSESRADVALKDESACVAADWAAVDQQRIKEMEIKLKAQHGGGLVGEFWADVGQSDSD